MFKDVEGHVRVDDEEVVVGRREPCPVVFVVGQEDVDTVVAETELNQY